MKRSSLLLGLTVSLLSLGALAATPKSPAPVEKSSATVTPAKKAPAHATKHTGTKKHASSGTSTP